MPHIHGRTYAEIDEWRLPSRRLRLFVELGAAQGGRRALFDIDALRVFLESRGGGCSIDILTSGSLIEVRRVFAGLAGLVEVVGAPTSSAAASKVEELLGDQRESLGTSYGAIETAREADADVVVAAIVPTKPSAHVVRRTLDMTVCGWQDAMRECEVFCRGHDVPWSFAVESWGLPFQGLYTFSEPPTEVFKLRDAAAAASASGDTVELIRSLGLNRMPAIGFTRDRLLYHLQQRRRARRNGTRRSEAQFELDYYLNHYYLLLWGGLDQMCWIVNGVLALGIKDHEHGKIGVNKDVFLSLVKDKSDKVSEAFTNAEFVAWRKIVASARHHAAHRGITLASQLYFSDGVEPSTEELDEVVDRDPEWLDLVATLGSALAEESRDLFRFRVRVGKLREAPERVMRVTIDKRPGFVTPLINVEHNCEQFVRWTAKVAEALVGHLEGKPGAD